MEKVGKKLGMKIAAEIFADRNYEDDGNLVSRSKENAMITDPEIAKKHVITDGRKPSIELLFGKTNSLRNRFGLCSWRRKKCSGHRKTN